MYAYQNASMMQENTNEKILIGDKQIFFVH